MKRFVRNLRGSHPLQAVGIILTAPGEAQVDYGTSPIVRDERSGKYRRTRLFVMTLGYMDILHQTGRVFRSNQAIDERKTRLEGLSTLEPATDRSRPAVQTFPGSSLP